MYSVPSAAPAAKTSGRAGDQPAARIAETPGSVTWTGSLSHNEYDNNVSRITQNVIDRFLNTPAGQPVLDVE